MIERLFRRPAITSFLILAAALGLPEFAARGASEGSGHFPTNWPPALRSVLENARPLAHPRAGRLPLFVLPISQTLAGLDDTNAGVALRELERRGIGYTTAWNPGDATNSLREAMRVARLQREIGMPVGVDATACLTSFFDDRDDTLHVDDAGRPFAETSFGGRLGCPYALSHRIPAIRFRVELFVKGYLDAGLPLDFVCADWEVDGPIEWNDAWASSKRCRRCREAMPKLGDFRTFQRRLRQIRSDLQRAAYASPILEAFPKALVGNYGVHPHEGVRYWYDYFEKEIPPDSPVPMQTDGRARYREWAHEFGGTRFTFANPVIYTWYRLHAWYDFAESDHRWFRNLLLEGSGAGKATPANIPLIPFVHWTTTDPPQSPDPAVRQFTAERYQELLWHLLLRGHDSFFLWCMPGELATEMRLLHPIYAESLAHRDFLDGGRPITFDVPAPSAPIISGLRLGDRVLVRRTDWSSDIRPRTVPLADGGVVVVPATNGLQVLRVTPPAAEAGFLPDGQGPRFPVGIYELPPDDAELRSLAAAGINLVPCRNRADLDRAHAAGLRAWMPLPLQEGPTDALRSLVESVKDHPALQVWEGPDEVVWNFTAYSGLARTAGFTREDWQNQRPVAVTHAEREASRILPQMREAIRLVRELDPKHRPIWINEAADSDLAHVRSYLDSVDITGCDFYPVRSTGTDLSALGRLVDRWTAVGRGKPVWMVLQAFSWHALKPDRTKLYPTPGEARFMAYDSIVRGARGVLFWGSWTIDEPAYRGQLLELTRELGELTTLLAGEAVTNITTRCIDEALDPPSNESPVRGIARRKGNEYLVLLVNEDSRRHLGVEVSGLAELEGRRLFRRGLAPGDASHPTVDRGAFVARLQGREVRVLTTEAAR